MQMIGFLAMAWGGMTLLNRFIEGRFITASDTSIMNTLTITHSQSIAGIFSVPIINTDFFFTGIPRLVKWDFSFFGGNASIIQFFLYSFTFAVSFMLFLVIIGMVFQFLSRLGR